MRKTTRVHFLATILIVFLLLTLISCSSQNEKEPMNTADSVVEETAVYPKNNKASSPTSISSANLKEYSITILETNDIHGRFEKMAEYATIINQVRKDEKNVILLDAGDVFKRGKYENYQGKIEMDIFNEIGYDAMVLGNNEFKVPGSRGSKRNSGTLYESDRQISNLVKWAKFPMLCSNVKLKDSDKYIDGIKPFTVLNINGVRVGIIGITSTSPAEEKLDMTVNKEFISGSKAVKRLLPEVEAVSDIQIVLSHAGMNVNRKINDVEAIISGHDHIKTFKPIVSDGIPIMQAGGEVAHYLGRLDLKFKRQDNKWVLYNFEGKLYSADGVEKDEGVKKIIDDYTTIFK